MENTFRRPAFLANKPNDKLSALLGILIEFLIVEGIYTIACFQFCLSLMPIEF